MKIIFMLIDVVSTYVRVSTYVVTSVTAYRTGPLVAHIRSGTDILAKMVKKGGTIGTYAWLSRHVSLLLTAYKNVGPLIAHIRSGTATLARRARKIRIIGPYAWISKCIVYLVTGYRFVGLQLVGNEYVAKRIAFASNDDAFSLGLPVYSERNDENRQRVQYKRFAIHRRRFRSKR